MKRTAILFVLLLFSPALAFTQAGKSDHGKISYKTAKGTWTFTAYTTDIIETSFVPKGYSTGENVSDAVIANPDITAVWQVQSDANKTVLQWKKVVINISDDSIYFGSNRQIVLAGYNESGEYRGFKFLLHDGEHIFGGGERALPLNRRGYRFNLYNNPWYGYGNGADNLNYSVPFITSSERYGLFFNNASKGYVDIGKTDNHILEYGACSGELNFYLITGNDYPAILHNYCNLTGTQPLPPRWALGNFMSRFGYTAQQQADEIYKKMRDANVPFDAVIFDLFWFGDSIKNTLGNLDWVNKAKWPDPAKMISDYKKDNVQTILVTEPFILQGTKSYDGFKPYLAVDSLGKPFALTDFYFGPGGLVDIFRKDAKDHFWTFYKKQMDIGVEGWWGDLGEPEKHPAGIYHNLGDLGYKRLFKADEVHNIYGHSWTKMLYEKYAKDYPDKRLFSLNRSGFAGTQRYSIFPWSGDVSRSWSGLQAQLPVMLGMSMSGIPYAHADAGGFAGGEGDKELYVRWLEYAQYTPIFRPHGTALYEVDPNAFSFPSEIALIDEPYRAIATKVANQRYWLLPYNYTSAYNQAAKAEPIVSPLYYYFGDDAIAVEVGDEFMNGRNLLIAPVLEKGITERKVYLPKAEWYELNSSSKQTGGVWITKTVTVDQIPVFVKAGSFIPTLPDGKFIRNTAEYNSGDLAIHYYPGTTSSDYDLFDDDGASKQSVSSGKYELISFKATPAAGGYSFKISAKGGSFKNKPATNRFHFVIHNAVANYKIGNAKGTKITQSVDKAGNTVLDFTFVGQPLSFSLMQ